MTHSTPIPANQYLVFTSDLHLRLPDEPKALSLEKLVRGLAGPSCTLVLGGDIFDLFIGSKDFFRLRFKSLLAEFEGFIGRGGTLVYLEGNHDFQLQALFEGKSSGGAVLVFSEDFSLSIGNKQIFISHGDQINRRDYGYLFLRALLRSWPLRLLINLLPGDLIGGIGDWSSRRSRAYTGIRREDSDRIQATRDLFRRYADARFAEGYDLVLLGHTHIEDDYQADRAGRRHQMLNLGFDAQELLYTEVRAVSRAGVAPSVSEGTVVAQPNQGWWVSGRRAYV